MNAILELSIWGRDGKTWDMLELECELPFLPPPGMKITIPGKAEGIVVSNQWNVEQDFLCVLLQDWNDVGSRKPVVERLLDAGWKRVRTY